ncbi:MAG: isoprenyl transferase [Rhodospirillaceae bacterium]|jgi:undecaprenyl diphosphate synthase|nr:isoprenyl transferase [Rhodospirillaceae bacterium]MBT6138544.1 isoprenyl transferase [Rhodospirillaceae bacterium]
MDAAFASDGDHPPAHVAAIMDGNGRWARARGLPRTEGHRRGAEVVRQIVKASSDLGISYLTLFGFSSENWKRPWPEVFDLMGLLRRYLSHEIDELDRQGVCFKAIGDRSRFEPDIVALIEEAEERTQHNRDLTLVLALSYGGRAEIAHAAKALAEQVAAGEITADEIDEAVFAGMLETSAIPDPDLLIRTGGEKRISNFTLWQCAYTEFVFLDTLWPDFTRDHLEAAIAEFRGRERRYGAVVG